MDTLAVAVLVSWVPLALSLGRLRAITLPRRGHLSVNYCAGQQR